MDLLDSYDHKSLPFIHALTLTDNVLYSKITSLKNINNNQSWELFVCSRQSLGGGSVFTKNSHSKKVKKLDPLDYTAGVETIHYN